MRLLATGAGSYAGPLGLLVILLLGVATFFLFRNMSSKITHLPETFEPSDDEPDERDKPDE